MKYRARLIAFYLPQFHPTAKNDEWWGRGFTEWTNVTKMKPLYRGHYQPRLPGELGFYDLRVAEVREAQADLAREHGVEGFCYWHYWFGGGERILERPFNEVLESGKPDFPFCLAWANESWKGFAHGVGGRNVLQEQLYGGVEDYTAHFHAMLPAFRDKRYMTVDDKPLFMIYKPLASPEVRVFIDTWRRLAAENGLSGIFFVGHSNENGVSVEQILATGVDAVNPSRLFAYNAQRSFFKRVMGQFNKVFRHVRLVYPYKTVSKWFVNDVEDCRDDVFPTIIPDWDHSPRSGRVAFVLSGSTPELFGAHAERALEVVANKDADHRIVFIKSWNEWAEGNYMEPDAKWGRAYLETLSNLLDR